MDLLSKSDSGLFSQEKDQTVQSITFKAWIVSLSTWKHGLKSSNYMCVADSFCLLPSSFFRYHNERQSCILIQGPVLRSSQERLLILPRIKMATRPGALSFEPLVLEHPSDALAQMSIPNLRVFVKSFRTDFFGLSLVWPYLVSVTVGRSPAESPTAIIYCWTWTVFPEGRPEQWGLYWGGPLYCY